MTENDPLGAGMIEAAQGAGWDVAAAAERGQPVRGAPAPALPAHAGQRLRRPLRRRAGGGALLAGLIAGEAPPAGEVILESWYVNGESLGPPG